MRARWMVSLLAASVLVIGGSAIAATSLDLMRGLSIRQMPAACEAMLGTSAMQQQLDQLPAERRRCEAMHGQMPGMAEMMRQMTGMMDGSGMMHGSAGTG